MFTVFKIATAFAVAYVLWTNIADADPWPGSHDTAGSGGTHELQGPGPFLIINDNKAVVGVVQDGVAIAMEGVGSGTPFGTKDNPATIRLQTQSVLTEPRSWHPEPATCPRGIKVMRYGSWGC